MIIFPTGTLDRYLFRELRGPFVFGLSAFMSLFVASELLSLARLIVELAAPLGTVAKLFVLRLPQMIVWSLPMSVLLAVLLSLSRLSSTSEMVAARAAGMSLFRLVAPALVTGGVMAGVALYLNERLVPAANEGYRTITLREVGGLEMPKVTRNVILKRYSGGSLSWFLYAAQFDGKVMEDVTMVSLEGGRLAETTYAEKVSWVEGAWVMEKGERYVYGGAGQAVSMEFSGGRVPVSLGATPEQIVVGQKTPEEMTMRELRQHITILRSQGQDVRQPLVQLHFKLALPLASLIFAVVGAPLGLQPHRSASSIGFGLSIVVIFVYYVLMTVGSALGQGGYLPPALAAWLENMVLGGVGLVLLLRASR
ncbi:MAG: LptF/LptG family permease [Firmicutes bacterium]|nr:LptF/LptG family permease [Bacillota bacterium]